MTGSVNFKYALKCLIIGDSGVGKSSLLLRYTNNTFNPEHDLTIGIEFGTKTITTTDNEMTKLQIWDCAGQKAYKSIVKSYYRNCAVVLLAFDITRRETFEHVDSWILDYKQSSTNKQTEIILVGTKLDMSSGRTVSEHEAFNKGLKYGIDYIEVSSKTDTNIKDAFETPAREVLHKLKYNQIEVSEFNGIRTNRLGNRNGTVRINGYNDDTSYFSSCSC